jgi:hypothetical protein
MRSVVHDGRPGGEPGGDLDLLLEKGVLLLGSIEFQIEEHLMSHGTRIGPETRLFMAQVRDAAGDAAAKMLDEARSRMDQTACGEDAPEPACPEAGGQSLAGGQAPAGARLLPARVTAPRARLMPPSRGHGFAFGRAAGHLAIGTASAALIGALLVAGQAPSGASTGLSGSATVAHAASDPEGAGRSGPIVLRGPLRPRSAHVEAPRPDPHPGQAEEAARRHAGRLAALALRPAQPFDLPPYPDPRAGAVESSAGAAAPEKPAGARLPLSAGARREEERRLSLAQFDPHRLDGIFGPATGAALGGWESPSGLPEADHLYAEALSFLRDGTVEAHRAPKKARARQQGMQTVLRSPVPRVSPLRAIGCSRTPAGKIVYGRGVRCDFRGLRQSIARLFG